MPGRRKGSRNVGYFFRDGRGWFAKDAAGKFVALLDESGERLRDKAAIGAVRDAYARFRLAKQAAPAPIEGESIKIHKVFDAYLDWVRQTSGKKRTFDLRRRILFEFATGLPAKFLDKPKKATSADRKHEAYGMMAVAELKRLHIDRWLQAHPEWKGSQRTMIQAIKRALNYATESGMIPANPIKGYKTPKPNARATYLTPEQEEAIYRKSKAAFAMSLRVLIATGARPGCEFAKLTAKHVRDYGDRMAWVFSADESKTRKEREIRITDPNIIAMVRKQVAAHRSGPIFRSESGKPWTIANLSTRFRTVKRALAKGGVKLDDDAVIYSTRHTFAKRLLEGYGARRPISLQSVAALMGNSPEICAKHYGNWGTAADHLWAALG